MKNRSKELEKMILALQKRIDVRKDRDIKRSLEDIKTKLYELDKDDNLSLPISLSLYLLITDGVLLSICGFIVGRVIRKACRKNKRFDDVYKKVIYIISDANRCQAQD